MYESMGVGAGRLQVGSRIIPFEVGASGAGTVTIGGRFELLEVLGAGGMGTVYRAHDRERGIEVALKIAHAGDPAATVRLKRELRALGRQCHPNLLAIHELVALDDASCLVCELVAGVPLLAYLRGSPPARRGADTPTLTAVDAVGAIADEEPAPCAAPADAARIRELFRQLAAALCALHESGYVHRDVKPSNVLVTREGRVVLIDFGAVIAAGERLTDVVGTRGYLAPEAPSVDTAAPPLDWYAVGVMLFEALHGRRPSPGERSITSTDPEAADLHELCAALLAPDPDRRSRGRTVLARLRSAPRSVARRPLAARARASVFVGRGDERARLWAAYRDTRAGRARLVRISGGAGVGKTALVERFFTELAAEEPVVILRGRCYECASVPYKAIDSLVEDIARHVLAQPAEERAALMPRGGAALQTVFPIFTAIPELAAQVRTSPRPEDGTTAALERKRRALVALRELIARIADRGPLVLFIDDVQWGDRDSAPLLASLFDEPEPPSLLLLTTQRDGQPAPLLDSIDSIDSCGGSARRASIEVPLAPLSPDDARALSRVLLTPAEAEAGAALIAQVARESGGNPYFIRELSRHAAHPTGDARSLAETICTRVSGLEVAARRVLTALAVAGRPVAHRVLQSAARLDGVAYLAAIRNLRAENLIAVAGLAEGDSVDVFHDWIRDAVVGGLDPATRRELHGVLALALRCEQDVRAEELVGHWQGAGDAARAAEVAARAAHEAAEVLAFDRAAGLCRVALELERRAACGPSEDARTRADQGAFSGHRRRALEHLLADMLSCAGELRAAADVLCALADSERDADAALELRRRAAEFLLRCGDVRRGRRVLDQVLEACGARPPGPRALQAATVMEGRVRQRSLRFEPRPQEACDPRALQRIDVLWSACVGMTSVDPLLAAYFQTRNLALALEVGEPRRLMHALWAHTFTAAVHANAGDRARDAARLADELARRTGDRRGQAMAVALHALVDYGNGMLRPAMAALEQSIAMMRATSSAVGWDIAIGQTCWVLAAARAGEWNAIAGRLPEVLADTEARGDRFGAAMNRANGAVARWLYAGDRERAAEQLHAARAQVDSDTSIDRAWCEMAAARLALADGRPRAALASVQQARRRSPMVFREVWPLWACAAELSGLAALAHLARRPGRLDALRATARATREIARLRGRSIPGARPYADLLAAQLADHAGDAGRARTFAEAALRGFTGLGMTVETAAARHCHGVLRGGSVGASERDAAVESLRACGVRAPEVALAMHAPMFAGR